MNKPAKVVARYMDGRILKGHTQNFDPKGHVFALKELDSPPDQEPTLVKVEELKALFFVTDFIGDHQYNERKEFIEAATGRRLAVKFTDGEVLIGTSLTYDTARTGFFLFPADRSSNNIKIYVNMKAVLEVRKVTRSIAG